MYKIEHNVQKIQNNIVLNIEIAILNQKILDNEKMFCYNLYTEKSPLR